MGAVENIQTIKSVYEAFGRGDVEAILATVTDDVDWATESTSDGVVRFVARSRETGRSASMDLHHWFRFRDGQIARYRGSEDTAITVATLA